MDLYVTPNDYKIYLTCFNCWLANSLNVIKQENLLMVVLKRTLVHHSCTSIKKSKLLFSQSNLLTLRDINFVYMFVFVCMLCTYPQLF